MDDDSLHGSAVSHHQSHERWRDLCEQASTEQDPDQLLIFVKEINDLLEARKDRLSKVNRQTLGERG